MEVRDAVARDVEAILTLFRAHLAREPDRDRVTSCVTGFPSAVLVEDGRVERFAYATRFAPDVLELANVLVAPRWRDQGWGGRLVRHVEDRARGTFAAVVLVNSTLYGGAPGKRPATGLYLRLGYAVVASTPATSIFHKAL